MLKSNSKLELKKTLYSYKLYIDNAIEEDLSHISEDSLVHRAMKFSISNGGKRFRPSLCLMVADSFNKRELVKPLSVGVEYFHTASLIADDLPCMDDAKTRRSKPAVHVQFDESIALLASYALISEGYLKACSSIKEAAIDNPSIYKAGIDAIENICSNTGIKGAVLGQCLDIFSDDFSKESVERTLEKKTVTLFELPLVASWLICTNDCSRIEEVKQMAYHFGLAFQLTDDLDDYEEDKNEGRSINWAVLFGMNSCKEKLEKHCLAFKERAKSLGLWSESFKALHSYLVAYID
ncbi:MAG: polyprenyl synthetase family protein [Chlamydiales bacterium]|nr:polyprenyl synthetase family protein [Chlamydiales bacterium]